MPQGGGVIVRGGRARAMPVAPIAGVAAVRLVAAKAAADLAGHHPHEAPHGLQAR